MVEFKSINLNKTTNKVEITVACPICGKESTVIVEPKEYLAYECGQLVRIAFAAHPAAEREKLISGMCDKCQEEMFAPEDEWDNDNEDK